MHGWIVQTDEHRCVRQALVAEWVQSPKIWLIRALQRDAQVLVAGWKVPIELPPSQLTTAPVM
jgi:hypothetical protein